MSSIESKVCKKINDRAEVGVKKYGTTMERKDLSLGAWINHLQEELMDAAVYTEKILDSGIMTVIENLQQENVRLNELLVTACSMIESATKTHSKKPVIEAWPTLYALIKEQTERFKKT